MPLDPLWSTTTQTRTQATRLGIHPPDRLRLRELRTRPKKPALSLQQHLAFRVVVEKLSGCSAITRSHDSIRQRPTIRALANKHVVPATLSVRNDPSRFFHRSSVKLAHDLIEMDHFAQHYPNGPVLSALLWATWMLMLGSSSSMRSTRCGHFGDVAAFPTEHEQRLFDPGLVVAAVPGHRTNHPDQGGRIGRRVGTGRRHQVRQDHFLWSSGVGLLAGDQGPVARGSAGPAQRHAVTGRNRTLVAPVLAQCCCCDATFRATGAAHPGRSCWWRTPEPARHQSGCGP